MLAGILPGFSCHHQTLNGPIRLLLFRIGTLDRAHHSRESQVDRAFAKLIVNGKVPSPDGRAASMRFPEHRICHNVREVQE